MKNCPYCNTSLQNTTRYSRACILTIKTNDGADTSHFSFANLDNKYVIDFYNFSYSLIKNELSVLTVFDSYGDELHIFNIKEINIFELSYQALEQKLKNILLFT